MGQIMERDAGRGMEQAMHWTRLAPVTQPPKARRLPPYPTYGDAIRHAYHMRRAMASKRNLFF